MPYQIILGECLSSRWYEYPSNSNVQTEKTTNEEYETLGTFSQGTNWEKIFTLGDKINRDLRTTEQAIIDDIARFRKRRKR